MRRLPKVPAMGLPAMNLAHFLEGAACSTMQIIFLLVDRHSIPRHVLMIIQRILRNVVSCLSQNPKTGN